MSDIEDDEASDEGEDIIEAFDCLNFNDDNDSNFIWYYEEPETRKRGPSDIIKVTAGLTDSSKGIETIRDAFDLFITNDIKDIILR